MKKFWGIFFLSLIFIMHSHFSFAQEIPLKVLALYDAKQFPDYFFTPVHQFAALPLNHLGLEIVPQKIQDPLPTDDQLTGVRGIVTWFDQPKALEDTQSYCTWLSHQMQQGRRVVILGLGGFFEDAQLTLSSPCQKMLQTLGIEISGELAKNPYFFEIVFKDPEMMDFERKLSFADNLEHIIIKSLSAQNRSYLTIQRTDMKESLSHMVLTTPHGGFAFRGYVQYRNQKLNREEWLINPFLFFTRALDLEGLPKPDTTTINGRRIFYSHIDGDGIFNVSQIDHQSFSGEIILKEILEKYSFLPITASLITGYFDLPTYNTPRIRDLYQKIFSLPNIEPAAHGYAHPFIWSKKTVALQIPNYTFNAEKETIGSLQMMNNLLKDLKISKSASLYQWTGNCLPDESTANLFEKTDFLDINGGDTQMTKNSGYSYVSGLILPRSPHRQVYSSAANENLYTNLWQGPYYGFQDTIQTFENTEKPIRLKPINIYYHYYSGEFPASLNALKKVYDFALTQPIFPVFTSEFVKIARDFFKIRIFSNSDGSFTIESHDLKTIRFDHETRFVDMKKSSGVLGFTHFQNNLYISLSNEKSNARIVLTNTLPDTPYLISSNRKIDSLTTDSPQKTISFKTEMGWLAGEVVLGGLLRNHTYRMKPSEAQQELKSTSEGTLSIPITSREKTTITLEPLSN